MPWFHPKTLLDKTYEIGLFFKGLDGALETLGGLFLLLVPGEAIGRWAHDVTQGELAHDPHDFIATHLLHYGQNLAHGRNWYVIAFLLAHGVTKVALVVALLRNEHWAYPWALGILGAFLLYQLYEFALKLSVGMGFLSVVDAVVIWLIWREWQERKRLAASSA